MRFLVKFGHFLEMKSKFLVILMILMVLFCSVRGFNVLPIEVGL